MCKVKSLSSTFLNQAVVAALVCFFAINNTEAKTLGAVIKNIEKSKANLPKTREASKTPPQSNINLKLVRPTSTNTNLFKEGTNEAEYEKLLNQQINQLYSLSKKTRSKAMQGDVWLRLAKAYTEKSALVERRINEEFDKKINDYFAKKISSKPVLNMGPAQDFNKKAVELYKWYLRDNPKSPNSDQVLFFLGYNTMSLGDSAASVKYYEALSSRFPNSEFVIEANLSLADYYFDQGAKNYAQSKGYLEKAEDYYQKIIKSRSRLSSIATYKLAWVNLKLNRSDQALAYITRVIRDGKFADQRKVSSDRLSKEAQKELPMFYAQVKDYKKSISYFKASLPKEDVAKSLEQLALLYADSGNREGAGFLFDYLSKTGDLSVGKVFDFQYKKVQLAESKGGIINSRAELLDLIEAFGPKTKWAEKARKEDAYDEPYKKMEGLAKNYALTAHKASRLKPDDLISLRKADEAYKIYLENFVKEDKDAEIRFFHAELLYEAKQFAKAADMYMEVSKVQNSKYAEKSKLNALLSIEKALPSIDGIKQKVGDSTEVYPLEDSEKKFISLTQEYLANPKNTESRVEVMYKMASILYAHNYLTDAEKQFKDVIKEFPKSQYAEYSTNLILDIYNLRKDYKGLERVGLELLENKSVNNEKAMQDVKNVVEKSAFKGAEEAEKANKPLDAAKSYLDFYKKYPKSTLAALALYNSAINFEKADRKNLAIETYERYRAEADPKVKEYAKTFLFTGILRESLGDLAGAVRDYESYIKISDPKTIEASLYYNIAIIFEGLKNFTKVKEYFNLYSARVKPEEAKNIIFRQASYADELGLAYEAITLYKKYVLVAGIDQDLKIEAVGRLALLSKESGAITQSITYFNESVKLQSQLKSKKNAQYAAESMFIKTDKVYNDLKAITIGTNPATQQSLVQKKIKLVEDLRKSTEAVIAYDAPEWIVAALTRMGQGYQHLAFALVSAPVPKELNAEEATEYKTKIAEIANPFKTNAVQSYQNAIDRAESLAGFGPYYQIARDELFNISPSSTYLADDDYFKILNYDENLSKDETIQTLSSVEGDSKQLIDKLGEALEKNPQDVSAYEFMAKYYFKKTMYHMAKIYLNKITNKNNLPRVSNNLGVINLKLDLEKEAQKDFERAINLEPDYVLARINFTYKFINQNGFSPVLSDLESLFQKTKGQLSKSELFRQVATNYGVALARTKNFTKAVQVNQDILSRVSKDASVLKNQSLYLITGLKNKVEGAKVLTQFKSIARNKKDLDTIVRLEEYLKTL